MGVRRTLDPFATEVLEVGASAVGLSTDKYLLADRLIDGAFEIWTSSTVPRFWTPSIAGTSTVNREGTTKKAGTYGLKFTIDALNSNASVYQEFKMIPGRYYLLDFYYQNSTSGKTSKVTITSGSNVYLKSDATWDTSSQYITLVNSNGAWTQYTLEFAAYGSYEDFSITFANLSATSSNIFVDSVRLVETSTGRAVFPEPAVEAFGVLESAEIRYSKATIPTSTTGEILGSGQNYTFDSFDDIRKFEAIRTGSTNGLLTVEYKR